MVQKKKIKSIIIYEKTFSASMWREIGGSRLDQFAYVPAKGSAGGMIIGWNSAILTRRVVTVGEFSLMIDFICKLDILKWRCTTVYGPTVRNLKQAFWEEIRACKGPHTSRRLMVVI